jgi:SNF family Na+-dependent transporter
MSSAEKSKPIGDGWGSRIGVILAVAGSAVGLGNFLRFPGQAAANGGGAFMIPYFISLLVLGIPLCWAEWTMGRYGGLRGFNSAPGIYRKVGGGRWSMYFGVIGLMMPLVVYMYYVLIEAWCLSYALQYLSGDLLVGGGGRIDTVMTEIAAAKPELASGEVRSQAYGQFFADFVGQNKDGFALGGPGSAWLWVIPATFLFNFFLIYRGISAGIEKFCRVAMPVMAILAVVVLVRVLTLGTPDAANPSGNVANGLGFMWNPRSSDDINYLARPETWLAAAGQIFFSLSVGFGIIINYASYLKRDDDVVLSGLTSSSVNEFFEVCLGGMITIPAAFIFLGVAGATMGGFGLGFVALPNVFAFMPGGQLFGFLWFFMLFLAAITSSVSMLQPVIAFLEEGFGLKRHASATLLGLLSALGTSFVLYFSKDLVALDAFDFWVGTFLIYVLAMFQAILYGWVLGIDRGAEAAHEGASLRIPMFVQYMLKFVTPVFLLVIFAAFCVDSLPSKAVPAASLSTLAFDDAKTPVALKQVSDALIGNEKPAPKSDVVSSSDPWFGPPSVWLYDDPEGIPTYVVRRSDDGKGVVVSQWKPGRLATIMASTESTLSVGFLLILAFFLLMLVHIAGRRWEKEGRFNPPTAS